MAAPRFPILFIAPSRIGDAVLASGLIRTLIDEVPGARFTFVASELTAPLFGETPGLERVIVMEKKPAGAHWFGLWRQVRGRPWGLVVDLRGSTLASLLRPKRRAVRRKASAPGVLGRPPVHKVVEAAELLKLADAPPAPFLYTSLSIEDRAQALTAGSGPILAVAPAAHWIGKTWPAERFAMTARALLGPEGPLPGGRLMVMGGPEDIGAAAAVKAAVPKSRRIDLVGREDLLTVYACLKRARLFIGADSGLMHMAAAAGAPTLGLFGPSDESLYGPWGAKARTVRGPRDFAEFRAIDPTLSQAMCHMMDLSPAPVIAAARALIEDTAPGDAHG